MGQFCFTVMLDKPPHFPVKLKASLKHTTHFDIDFQT